MVNVTGVENVYEAFFKEYPDVLDLEQICEILRVSKKMGYVLLQGNKIKSLRIGSKFIGQIFNFRREQGLKLLKVAED